MNANELISGKVSSHWRVIHQARHPNDNGLGLLVQNCRTGVYCLVTGGSYRSVPQRWASEEAAKTTQ